MPEPRPRPSALARFGQFAIRLLARVIMRLYFRWRLVNVPKMTDGFVVVANHGSFLDPMVVGAACPRNVSFLINAVTYRSPLMGWFYRLFEAIPVDLGGRNRASLRTAREQLAGGAVVGVFPEGGITRDGGMLLGNPGAVALVLANAVHVVPVGLRGVAEAFPYGASFPRPKRIEVHFGEPIPAAELMVGDDRKQRLTQATERLMREIGQLCGQESREDELRRQKS